MVTKGQTWLTRDEGSWWTKSTLNQIICLLSPLMIPPVHADDCKCPLYMHWTCPWSAEGDKAEAFFAKKPLSQTRNVRGLWGKLRILPPPCFCALSDGDSKERAWLKIEFIHC